MVEKIWNGNKYQAFYNGDYDDAEVSSGNSHDTPMEAIEDLMSIFFSIDRIS